MKFKKPILITGSHRSGTTWVGKVIASSTSIGYIHEPFGLNYGKEICKANFQHWFQYVCDKNEYKFIDGFREMLEFNHDLLASLRTTNNWRARFRTIKQHFLFKRYFLANARPLIKDPIALFSAELINARFGADVIVMIRHPAAFVNSIIKIGWVHPFNHFLEQGLLMTNSLYHFESDIRNAVRNRIDPIDQAILIWKMAHHVILKYKIDHPEWVFIRHEDISRDPFSGFELIFNKLNLEFGKRERKAVEKHSFNTSNNSPGSWDTLRNSYDNLYAWKRNLNEWQIERIRLQVSEISNELYSQDEW